MSAEAPAFFLWYVALGLIEGLATFAEGRGMGYEVWMDKTRSSRSLKTCFLHGASFSMWAFFLRFFFRGDKE